MGGEHRRRRGGRHPDLCGIGVDDGITFDPESLAGEEIRAAEEYVGARVRLEARLAGARISVQVDVGFGDAVVAEKLEAMVTLGVTNSRMKDFYDVHLLASSFAFEGSLLARAIRATFERPGTPIPETQPLVLTREFLAAPERQTL